MSRIEFDTAKATPTKAPCIGDIITKCVKECPILPVMEKFAASNPDYSSLTARQLRTRLEQQLPIDSTPRDCYKFRSA